MSNPQTDQAANSSTSRNTEPLNPDGLMRHPFPYSEAASLDADRPNPGRDTIPLGPLPPSIAQSIPSNQTRSYKRWEAFLVFAVTLAALVALTPRMITYLNPVTGDEPFYLMTATSIWNDGDINECNNYRQRDEARLYPPSLVTDNVLPYGWLGWNAVPYPLPPHIARIVPEERRCFGTINATNYYVPDTRFPLPPDGSESELYSKHGLGLSLLITLPFALGGRLFVVFFLNFVGALVAANIYLLARESVNRLLPAILTWLAFAFTIPFMAYSFLIFPELPAALLTIYAFRRIRLGKNNIVQLLAVGSCIAFLPWLHYRFIPMSAGLALFYLYQGYRPRLLTIGQNVRRLMPILAPSFLSAVALMSYFYFLYRQVYPNTSDHAGINDVAGTIRGVVGLFIDQQWGLFVAAPVYILALVGLVLMVLKKEWRNDLKWVAIITVPYFLIVANYAQWWGEWCPPARYLAAILPVAALPFALALKEIKSIAYKAIYGVLLALSYLVMFGFGYQPHWMYNQPNGTAALFANGLPQLLSLLPANIRPDIDLTAVFPTFVVPYFAYTYYGRALGDQWTTIAWHRSAAPLGVVALILAVSLGLAWWQGRSARQPGKGGKSVALGQAGMQSAKKSIMEKGSQTFSAIARAFTPFSISWQMVGAGFSPRSSNSAWSVPTVMAFDAPSGSSGGTTPEEPERKESVHEAASEQAPVQHAIGAVNWSTRSVESPSEEPIAHEGSPESNMEPAAPVHGNGSEVGSQDGSEQAAYDVPQIGAYGEPNGAEILVGHGLDGDNGPNIDGIPVQAAEDLDLEEAPARVVRRNPLIRALLMIWSLRGLWLGLIAVGFALNGQKIVVETRNTLMGIRWYAAAIALILLAFLGTYKNRSFLLSPDVPAVISSLPSRVIQASKKRRIPAWVFTSVRYLLAFIALGINYFSVNNYLHLDWYSQIGSVGWLASLALLLVAFIGYRPKSGSDADANIHDIEDRTDIRIPRRVELLVLLGILILTFALRVYRLDDWTTGMHGDEGEAGMDAISILEGNPVSPFLTGWFDQPNFYYWAIALTMKVFGTGMFGLRMFVTIVGSLLVLPLYGLTRMWFGVRTAIIASVLYGISDVAIHFSRQEFSNITTPFSLTAGFYFLFRGLRNRRMMEFIISAYIFMLGLYFYLGGRLTPFLVAAVFGYLFVLMPIVRLPGVYGQLRRGLPGVGRLKVLGKAVWRQVRGVMQYSGHLLIFGIAAFCMVTPWLAYYFDNAPRLNGRTQDKLIFGNPERMAATYGRNHDPLFIGIRMPTEHDIYPFSPIVFERTPLSIQVSQDGFWPRIMWDQLTTSLSVLTYRFDESSVYTFTMEPVAKPIEAALIILGIAFALWRWRDTRMAVLSGWFWSAVLVGGVMTIDAPYMARMVGIIPIMAVFAAIIINKIVAEFLRLAHLIKFKPRVVRRTAQVLSGGVVLLLLLNLGVQNYKDYYDRYVAVYPFTDVTGLAYFVRQMNKEVTDDKRPTPRYYQLGVHYLYWGHGDNRFLNHGTVGDDMPDVADDLPVVNNEGRDVVFMVWDINKQYLSMIKQYYPSGEEGKFFYSRDGTTNYLFTYYRVKNEQLEARRITNATYTGADGVRIERQELAFGNVDPPPGKITYPATGSWEGGLFAPAFAHYRFGLSSTSVARLTIDGVQVVSSDGTTNHEEGEVILARGPHNVQVTSGLLSASDRVELTWSAGGSTPTRIARKYLISGDGKGLLGVVSLISNSDPYAEAAPDVPDGGIPVIQRRLDGFLGFRTTNNVVANGGPFAARWTGMLHVSQTSPQIGHYKFDAYSNGGILILIDGKQVLDNRHTNVDITPGHGEVDLTEGDHAIEVRYKWDGGLSYLEVYWTPPGQESTLIGPDVLHTDGGAWLPGSIQEPPGYQLPSNTPVATTKVSPANLVGATSGELTKPRGVAVDGKGNIYVADRGQHRIVAYSPDGKVIATWGKAPPKERESKPGPGEFNDLVDVAATDDGTVYTMDNVGGQLQVFSGDGKFIKVMDLTKVGTVNPNGIYVAPDGTVLIADTVQSRVLRFAAADDASQLQIMNGIEAGNKQTYDKLEQPVDAVAAPKGGDGSVYAIDLKNRLVQFSPDGHIIKQWQVQVGTAEGGSRLAISPDGSQIFMSDPDRGQLAIINITTGIIDYVGTRGPGKDQFGRPSGIAAGSDGRVYVVDSEKNDVQIFDFKKK